MARMILVTSSGRSQTPAYSRGRATSWVLKSMGTPWAAAQSPTEAAAMIIISATRFWASLAFSPGLRSTTVSSPSPLRTISGSFLSMTTAPWLTRQARRALEKASAISRVSRYGRAGQSSPAFPSRTFWQSA